ncbi:MAG: hypothetical protein RLZZ226_2162 [Pseudomonadota bacterium]|jgi:molybdopterin synthase catalytic subunit
MIELKPSGFEPYPALLAHQVRISQAGVAFGATCSFVGTLRDFNEGVTVSDMYLEHYPGMTEKFLARIADEARQHWNLADLLLIHRVGAISPGEAIVLIAVWSVHRGDAFDACRYLIEQLKSRAPFWKRETLPGGSHRWVSGNTDGYRGDSGQSGAGSTKGIPA